LIDGGIVVLGCAKKMIKEKKGFGKVGLVGFTYKSERASSLAICMIGSCNQDILLSTMGGSSREALTWRAIVDLIKRKMAFVRNLVVQEYAS
jgi:hypothetical protein